MRKIFSCVLVLILCFSLLSACTAAKPATAVEEAAAQPTPSPISTPEPSFNLTGQIPEQVIYDKDGLVVKALSLSVETTQTVSTAAGDSVEDVPPYLVLNLSIENNSGRCVTVKGYAISLNDMTVCDYIAAGWVDSGISAQDSFEIADVSDLNFCGITDVAKIDFTLRIEDSDTWEEIANDPVSIDTDIAGTFNAVNRKIPTEFIYDADGMRIAYVTTDAAGDYSYIGPGFILYVENTGDTAFALEAGNDVYLNDYHIALSETWEHWGLVNPDVINPGKCAFVSLIPESSNLAEGGFSSLSEVHRLVCNLAICDPDTYDFQYYTPSFTIFDK
jgi:hypothetical protein